MEKRVNEVLEALKGAADGAFVVDEELRIHIWNKAAEKILGFGNRDVVGQLCYQILQGYDEERRLICKACCQVAQLTLKGEPVSNYDIHASTNFGERRWLNMSIVTFKMGGNGDKKMIIHLFRDISQKKDDEMFFRRILEIARRSHKIPLELDDRRDPHHLIEKLTGREREVLILLSRGFNTQEIAETLSISPNTVRNHVQNILAKLGVHSRQEAIVYAYQNGLIEGNELWDYS
jgi:PAS domain S-box-containing protein